MRILQYLFWHRSTGIIGYRRRRLVARLLPAGAPCTVISATLVGDLDILEHLPKGSTAWEALPPVGLSITDFSQARLMEVNPPLLGHPSLYLGTEEVRG